MTLRSIPRAILVTATIGALLIAAVAFQLAYQLREVPEPVPRTRLVEALPKAVDGWSVAEESLGATEAVNNATLKTLNLDDFVYRRFGKGSQSFTVYAAFWAAGRMPTRLVASHTPDRCWTENGMRCVDMRFRENYVLHERALLPAEYRVFKANDQGTPIYVGYWHTVEGKVYGYGARFNAVPHPWLWWKDTLAQAAYGSREQLYVRIASTTPLETWWKDPDFQALMAKVADLGLWDRGATSAR